MSLAFLEQGNNSSSPSNTACHVQYRQNQTRYKQELDSLVCMARALHVQLAVQVERRQL